MHCEQMIYTEKKREMVVAHVRPGSSEKTTTKNDLLALSPAWVSPLCSGREQLRYYYSSLSLLLVVVLLSSSPAAAVPGKKEGEGKKKKKRQQENEKKKGFQRKGSDAGEKESTYG